MLRCLNHTQPDGPVKADIAIVGAGLAGLFLANRLAEAGLHVVVIESGGETQSEDVHFLNAVHMLAASYEGAAHGRFRCLGGTSTRWGGALLPYLHSDFSPHPCGWHDGWGTVADELANYLPEVEEAFGVRRGSYEGEASLAELLPSFVPRLPKWPAFRRRSTANIFRKRVLADRRVEVWLNATVTEVTLGLDNVRGATAQSTAGNRLDVEASHLVIAAGAIEATRLLLLLNRSRGGSIFPTGSPLGKGFHDHLSARIANLEATDKKALARLFSFRFVRGGMRNLRFELAPETRERNALPGAFLHVAFSRNEKSGFEAIRAVYQSFQKRQFPVPSTFSRILADAPWFAKASWWRFAEQRVLPPPASAFELHLVIEQEPTAINRIGLSSDRSDRFGQPLATICWSVSERDQAAFWRVARIAFDEWEHGDLAKLATIRPRENKAACEEMLQGGGIFHPAGTTRIGTNSSTGVVDDRLRVHGLPGLRVLSTSVYPSVGSSSPSLSLAQLAVRMAADIAREFPVKA